MVTGAFQGEDEFTSDAFRADYIDMLVMSGNDFFYNGQAQACSFFVFAAGQVRLVEAVPDQLHLFLGNTDAGIFYRDEDLVLFLRGLNLDC